jgi:hypothetical protein
VATLFTLTANGSTDWVNVQPNQVRGNTFAIMADGTFGGGTIQLESARNESATAISLDDGSFTANFHKTLTSPGNIVYRATLSGATSPNLTVEFKL